eukprot:10912313-Heterocapsa_arctica.AAC.1
MLGPHGAKVHLDLARRQTSIGGQVDDEVQEPVLLLLPRALLDVAQRGDVPSAAEDPPPAPTDG